MKHDEAIVYHWLNTILPSQSITIAVLWHPNHHPMASSLLSHSVYIAYTRHLHHFPAWRLSIFSVCPSGLEHGKCSRDWSRSDKADNLRVTKRMNTNGSWGLTFGRRRTRTHHVHLKKLLPTQRHPPTISRRRPIRQL